MSAINLITDVASANNGNNGKYAPARNKRSKQPHLSGSRFSIGDAVTSSHLQLTGQERQHCLREWHSAIAAEGAEFGRYLCRRHARLQLLKPVEHHIEALRRALPRICPLGHKESLAIAANAVIPSPSGQGSIPLVV